MNGRVAIGGVKIDDGVSYCAAACWAGVIDSPAEVPRNSFQATSQFKLGDLGVKQANAQFG